MMSGWIRALGWVFGVTMIVLSFMVTIETVIRKLFSVSLGGVDELSGYAVAVIGPLAFAIALVERSHIRINILYLRLTRPVKRVLDALSILTLVLLAGFLTAFAFRTLADTDRFNALAQTPWATPLVYPQSLWLVSTAVFSVTALVVLARAVWSARQRDWNGFDRTLSPGTVEEELRAELEDLDRR